MNSTFSALTPFLGLFGDAPRPDKTVADIVRSSSAMANANNQGRTPVLEDTDDVDFHIAGGMSFVQTVFAIAAVWASAIATVLALGA